MLAGTVAHMSAAEAHLRTHAADFTLHRTTYPDRDLSIVDILPIGSSKASALEHLANLRGISTDDILAIGDNWNDVPMLRLAGRSVLMSNAPADLKALAQTTGWTLAPTNDNDGVAAVIESTFAQVPA
jgi:hydroxymethylpyrimidine pyrophosphatase-like HAD family hydrolase